MAERDAWTEADPTLCETCGREACEDHLPKTPREKRLALAMENERLRREVRRLLDAEERPPVAIPEGARLRDRLARPVVATPWRIQGWQPERSRVLLAAQFKSGKTVARNNWIRSLVDGDPFLGRDEVTPITGTVTVFDLEMTEAQGDRWMGRQVIRDDNRVLVYYLRNTAGSLNLLDEEIRRAWAARLRAEGTEAIVLDCVRPVLDALGLDEHRDAGRFLVAFDQLLAEAGISEALVVHHMGHANERARGDSRLRDWPDVEWRLMRKDESPSSPRFIVAYGRDVDQPEAALAFDSLNHHLSIEGGSRAEMKKREALGAIVEVLVESGEPLSGRAIKEQLAGGTHARDAIDAALTFGVRTNALVQEAGLRKAKLYRPAPPVSECPGVSGYLPGH